MFSEYRERFVLKVDERDIRAMGVYLSLPSKVPKMKAFIVGRLEFRSAVVGDRFLGDHDARLVGEAPEAQEFVDPLNLE